MWVGGIVEGEQAPCPLIDLARVQVGDIGPSTLGILDTIDTQGLILVADWLRPDERVPVAHHLLATHWRAARAYEETLAVCDTTCRSVLRCLLPPLVKQAAGL